MYVLGALHRVLGGHALELGHPTDDPCGFEHSILYFDE